MSRWLITCGTCGETFEVPPNKNPDEWPPDRIILGMAVPQHPDPDNPEDLCDGSATVVNPERAG